jgi:kinesin family protein 3/17
MDQQRRQAEQDKMAAIRALEARSVEMMREKAEKRKLERRIAMLRSQMLGNFDNIKKLEEIPEFRNVQQKIHHQYVVFEREAREYC